MFKRHEAIEEVSSQLTARAGKERFSLCTLCVCNALPRVKGGLEAAE
jgi:hypothetical protein